MGIGWPGQWSAEFSRASSGAIRLRRVKSFFGRGFYRGRKSAAHGWCCSFGKGIAGVVRIFGGVG